MGVGASLRWLADAGLQSTLELLLAEMSTCSNDNGWFLPWSESEMAANWYSTSGMNVITEALIEADGVVSHDVMKMLRQVHDAYVNHTLLPVNLPANGGPEPVEPYAAGFDNVTSCGHGTDDHNIYFQYCFRRIQLTNRYVHVYTYHSHAYLTYTTPGAGIQRCTTTVPRRGRQWAPRRTSNSWKSCASPQNESLSPDTHVTVIR